MISDRPSSSARPEKQRVARQFSRAAAGYDQASSLQQEMGRELLTHLSPEPAGPLLDLGCGTGELLSWLTASQRPLWGLDLAPGMLEVAAAKVPQARWICGDAEAIPLPPASVAVVVSNAALQWCDPRAALRELARVLRPGGQWLISTFGPTTLQELRQAWQQAAAPQAPVHRFVSLDQWHRLAEEAGLSVHDAGSRPVRHPHPDPRSFLRACKRIGASYAGGDRRPLDRKTYHQLRHVLEQRRQQEGLWLTWECLFLHGRKPLTNESAIPPATTGKYRVD